MYIYELKEIALAEIKGIIFNRQPANIYCWILLRNKEGFVVGIHMVYLQHNTFCPAFKQSMLRDNKKNCMKIS